MRADEIKVDTDLCIMQIARLSVKANELSNTFNIMNKATTGVSISLKKLGKAYYSELNRAAEVNHEN